MTDYLTSLTRVLVPLIVGYLAQLGIVKALGLSGEALTSLVTAGVTAVYYGGVRALEHYVNPKFGWLLGNASAPIYVPKKVGNV